MMSLCLCFPSWWHDLFSWCSASMNCALDHATCMCAMDSDIWIMNLDCIRAKICIATVMLENRHTGMSLGQIISTMFTCRIRISECQHDPGFIDLFTPMAESHISSGPYFVDVDGPGKESRKGTKKKPKRVKADSRPSPVELLFFDRITAHNSSPFFLFTNAITEQGWLSDMWVYIIVEMLAMIVHNGPCQKPSSIFVLYAGHTLIVIFMSRNMICFKNVKPWSLKNYPQCLWENLHTSACGAI